MYWVMSHRTALEYWRRERGGLLVCGDPVRVSIQKLAAPAAKLEIPCGLTAPLDVLLSNGTDRRPSKQISCHVLSAPYPRGCFVHVSDDLLVSTPEFCFLQMATKLPLPKLIRLGYELCGAYCLIPNDTEENELVRYDNPLTNTARLSTFLAKMKGTNGHGRAVRALGYCANNSYSPMETILTIIFTLPYFLGGYGLPKPLLNHTLEVKQTFKKATSNETYVCDLYWPNQKLDVEYDSDTYHIGADRIARDARKRTGLSYMGIEVVTITRNQVFSSTELNKIAQLLSKRLGKRLRYEKTAFASAQSRLRTQLLQP
jgi:very-short-patch-repair endonuclease